MFTGYLRRLLGHSRIGEWRTPSGATNGAAREEVKLQKNLLGYWIVVKADDPGLAWSGSRWVHLDKYQNGIEAQVANFDDYQEAKQYISVFDFLESA